MASITTRVLGSKDRVDRQAVRVPASQFANKTGIIEILVAGYVIAGYGSDVEVRVPNHNSLNNDVLVSVLDSDEGSYTVDKKVYVAVNNGVPGPSVRVNPDGTWDLLVLSLSLPFENDAAIRQATLNYTVSDFIDLTPSNSNPVSGNASVLLNVSDDKVEDSAVIGISNASLAGLNGYIKVWINSIESVVKGDARANFAVTTGDDGCACGGASGSLFLGHPLAAISGVKTYAQAMKVYAVNNGKIDANGSQVKGTNGQAVALTVKLDSIVGEVDLTVSYNVSFNNL